MGIQNLDDFSDSPDPGRNPNIEGLNISSHETIYDTITPSSGRSKAYDVLHDTTWKAQQLPDSRTSTDDTLAKIGLAAPGELLTPAAPLTKTEAPPAKPEATSSSELLSDSSVENAELRAGALMIKNDAVGFAELVKKNWSSLDLNRNFFVSQDELCAFLKTARGPEERAMGRFLYSKYDEVAKIYNQTSTLGIVEDDLNVMAKALDKNAPLDPFRRDRRYTIAATSVLSLMAGARAFIPTVLPGVETTVFVYGWRVAAVPIAVGLGFLATYMLIKGSGKNYYEQKRVGIESMLNQTLSPDYARTKTE